MTEQEAFTKVRDHLLRQKEKCIVNGLCAYRGENGLKCAIGALITDEEYKEIEDHSHEFWAIYDLMVFQTENLQSLQGLDLTFLEDLQIIHDQGEIQDWGNQLEVFAEKYNLQYE